MEELFLSKNAIFSDEETFKVPPSVATIGFFDGVHKGHLHLLEELKRLGKERGGLETMAITFTLHPRMTLEDDFQPKLLTTHEEKMTLLKVYDIDRCIRIFFHEELAAMSAREFMQRVLHELLNVRCLLIGYNHRFGHNRAEGFEDYVRYGKELGIEVVRADAFTLDGKKISSSLVRSLIEEGRVDEAYKCLSRPYFLSGFVIHGDEMGRDMGFPTANITPDHDDKLVPGNGVYAVKVLVPGRGELLEGMMNIGVRPTFDGNDRILEVNIFDFSKDIYEEKITVFFYKRLRDEHRFNSTEELQAQLSADREEAKKLLSQYEI